MTFDRVHGRPRREGLRSFEPLVGIYLSARDGRAVGLPLEF